MGAAAAWREASAMLAAAHVTRRGPLLTREDLRPANPDLRPQMPGAETMLRLDQGRGSIGEEDAAP